MSTTVVRSPIKNFNRFIRSFFYASDGAWSWFSDPRAVRYGNNTYIMVVNSAGNVYVLQYNHVTNVYASFLLHAALSVDDHSNGAVLIRPDGKIQCFYSTHSVNGDLMLYRISTAAESIAAFGTEANIGSNTAGTNGSTYSNPFYLPSEKKYYIFWRGGDYLPAYATSVDGVTWTTAANLFSVSGGNRPYVKYVSNGSNRIHFAFTDGHPDTIETSLYYCYYENGNFYKADGTLIKAIGSLPITVTTEAEKIYNQAAHNNFEAWVWDIALDSNGYPVIVYTSYPSTTDHRYRYIRWNGSAWIDNEIISAGTYLYSAEAHYSGGICLDHQDPNIIYFSKQELGSWNIYRGVTNDNGETWKIARVTNQYNKSKKNMRPVSIWGADGGFDVLYMSGTYTTYISYSTEIRHV